MAATNGRVMEIPPNILVLNYEGKILKIEVTAGKMF